MQAQEIEVHRLGRLNQPGVFTRMKPVELVMGPKAARAAHGNQLAVDPAHEAVVYRRFEARTWLGFERCDILVARTVRRRFQARVALKLQRTDAEHRSEERRVGKECRSRW